MRRSIASHPRSIAIGILAMAALPALGQDKAGRSEIEAEILAPKLVRLNVTDMPILDAVSLLARESGYQIEVADNWAKLSKAKITVDTGQVPFWEAFELLRKKGGLVERGPPPSDFVGLPYNGAPAAIMPVVSYQLPALLDFRLPRKFVLSAISPVRVHSSIAGSMRVRLYEMPGLAKEDYRLLLDITPEPRLRVESLLAAPVFTHAIDDQGQEREAKSDLGKQPAKPQVLLSFQPAEKAAKSLRKLVGSIDVWIARSAPVRITIPFAFENVPLE